MLEVKPYQNKLSLRSKAARMLWNIACLLLYRPTPSFTLHGYRRFLLRLFGATIGKGCKIHPSCRIWAPWNLHMGRLVALAEGVECYSVDKITIGDKVTISQGAYLCAASHDFTSPTHDLITRPITIGSWSWVAARAFVGPGVTLGEGVVVGACAVVTRDVPPWTVVAGNPAKPIKERKIRREGE
ncbi:MAG: hypothetical protein JJU36_09230 [Phycisphaeraceae bacterium]|nr:hypothetical protein [Phycisphaeraceae bacterium]